MQAWMTSFLDTTPPSTAQIDAALVDFGFWHTPTEVKRMYAEYVNNHLLGYAGGVLDQPDEYWQDIATMSWLKRWVEIVAPLPRMEQEDVIDRLRRGGSLTGTFKGQYGND